MKETIKHKISEENIVKILKIAPVIFIPLTVITIIMIIVINNHNQTENDIEALRLTYMNEYKKSIKNDVERVKDLVIFMQKKTARKLKDRVKRRVYEAYAIAENIYNTNKGKKSDKEIKLLIANSLSNIRFFNNRGYYFINTNSGEAILFNGKVTLNSNKDVLNIKDHRGNFIVKDQIDIVNRHKEGFTHKYFKKIDTIDNKEYEKISFVKKFEPYDWHIGTGDYLEDIKKLLQKELIDRVEDISYGSTNYLFIFDKNANVVYHPSTKLIDKNIDDFSVNRGSNITDTIKESIANKKSTFVTYNYTKQNHIQNILEKTSYLTYVNNWDWLIGSGFYTKDLELKVSKEIQKIKSSNSSSISIIILFGIILLIVSIIVSFKISKVVDSIFAEYKRKILKKNQEIFIQKKQASMGELLSIIAHQLKQPINSISLSTDIIVDKYAFDELNQKEIDIFHNRVRENIDFMATSIDELRNLFRTDKKRKSFCIQDAIKKAMSLISIQLQKDNVSIELKDTIDNDITINGYKSELEQVILNLVSNSREVLLEKKIKDAYIKINLTKQKNSISIKVEDNGGGIDEDIIDNIFDSYFTTKGEKGTGIGLNLVKMIVEESLSGNIYVQNTDVGALFTIDIPLS
jgi:signal transduction histidine kinase